MKQPMNKLGIAIIGLGSALAPHLRSLADLADRVDLRWGVSRTEERRAAFARDHGVPVTGDIDAVLADPSVGALLILTPPNTHLGLAKQAFEASKHVLVEKPLDATLDRAERLVKAGRAADRRLGVVLQHRFRPGSLLLKRRIAEGALGTIAAASLAVPWWRPQSYYDVEGRGTLARDGGGVLLTQAIHSLDLFRSLADVTAVVAAEVATTALHRMETEDYAAALLRLGSGAPASMMATTAFAPGAPERIEIIGTRASAALHGGSLRITTIDGIEERLDAEGPTGAGANTMDFPHDAHRELWRDFLDAVADGRDPIVSGEEALATQRLIGEILRVGNTNPNS
jgi:predicted dehydrogenase